MSLRIKKKASADIPPMEGGTYLAACVGIVDLGEQYNSTFKNYSSRILIIFEIPSETIELDGEQKPRWLSKEFGATMNDKGSLKPFLTSWRGKSFTDEELSGEFDLSVMLNSGCMLQVLKEKKEDRVYNNVSSAIGLPVGIPAPKLINESFAFDMDTWDDAVFEKLPEWIQNKIKKSTEYQKKFAKPEEVDFPEKEENPVDANVLPTAQQLSEMFAKASENAKKKDGAPF